MAVSFELTNYKNIKKETSFEKKKSGLFVWKPWIMCLLKLEADQRISQCESELNKRS